MLKIWSRSFSSRVPLIKFRQGHAPESHQQAQPQIQQVFVFFRTLHNRLNLELLRKTLFSIN